MSKRVIPVLGRRSFNCPRCDVYCPQKLYKMIYEKSQGSLNKALRALFEGTSGIDVQNAVEIKTFQQEISANERIREWDFYVTICSECEKYAIWENKKMIFPLKYEVQKPSEDMPDKVKEIYDEAANVYKHSPRAAAALLRLSIETLIPLLDGYTIKAKKLNNMIGELVAQKIPDHLQEALDIVRLWGNDGIHSAAEIDVNENSETVLFLFELVNVLVDELITRKKKIKSLFRTLPELKRNGIANRDSVKTEQ